MLNALRKFLLKISNSSFDLSSASTRKESEQASSVQNRSSDQIQLFDSRKGEEESFSIKRSLIEDCLHLWRSGHWHELIEINSIQFNTRPDRAEIALLIAAAHLQTGGYDAAKHFIRLSKTWGCEKRLISQVLIGGVHNSLALAATAAKIKLLAGSNFMEYLAAEHSPNILHDSEWAGDSMRFARLQQRSGLKTSQNNHSGTITSLSEEPDSSSLTTIIATVASLKEMQSDLKNRIDSSGKEIEDAEQRIIETLQKKLIGAKKEVNALLNLQSYLNTGNIVGEFTDWAICGELALWITNLIEKNNYDLIVEFGSGTSTVIIAKTLANKKHRRPSTKQPPQIAFEHLEKYHDITLSNLKNAGLESKVNLIFSPLLKQEIKEGETYLYYNCQSKLEKIAKQSEYKHVLLLVDGPPGITGKHARYPALPIIARLFPASHLDIILDDYERKEEREVAEMWLADLQEAGASSTLTAKRMEKDACLISVARTQIL